MNAKQVFEQAASTASHQTLVEAVTPGELKFQQTFKMLQNSAALEANEVTIHGLHVAFVKFNKHAAAGGGKGIATFVDGKRVRWNDALAGIRALDRKFPKENV